MVKYVLAGCSLLVALAVGSLPSQAQNPSSAPAQSPAPATVNSDELKKFASAVKKVLVIAQDMENQMVQVVKKEGLTEQRFNEIHQSRQNPSAKPTQQITPKEEQSYKQALSQLGQIQKDAQVKMDKAVESEGLKVERFNQIFAMVQKDPALRQEVRKLMQN
jgi:hypothetical protein